MGSGDASRRAAPDEGTPRTFRLRHGAHDLVLSRGEVLIGRTSECQLALHDPLISRRHARLNVGVSRVVIEDLGSSNGVYVNGRRIEGPEVLQPNDRILIGNEELVIFAASESAPFLRAQTARQMVNTIAPPPSGVRTAEMMEDAPTSTGDASLILLAMGDKALALGRAEEAERLLGPQIERCISDARRSREVPPELCEAASRRALRLGATTGKAAWLDRVIELHLALGRLMPAIIVDELYAVVRRAPGLDLVQLREYFDLLQQQSARFGPNDWFLLGRIQGLERLVGLR